MKRVFESVSKSHIEGGESNLSVKEQNALKNLKKRISNGSLVIATSDKSKRFVALTKEQYIQSGLAHTKGDIKIDQTQVKRIQNTVNNHTWWLSKILGNSRNADTTRMGKNIMETSCLIPEMSLLVKDQVDRYCLETLVLMHICLSWCLSY